MLKRSWIQLTTTPPYPPPQLTNAFACLLASARPKMSISDTFRVCGEGCAAIAWLSKSWAQVQVGGCLAQVNSVQIQARPCLLLSDSSWARGPNLSSVDRCNSTCVYCGFPARVHVLVSSQTHAKTIPYPATITGICGAGWDVLESKRGSPGSLNRHGAQPALQRRRRQSSLPLSMPKLGTAAG